MLAALLPLAKHLGRGSCAPSLLGQPVVLDRLCHGWRLHQVKNGYRFNGDDVLLAREALREVPAGRLLDLGAGTGSVGLLWLAQAKAHLTALEAQEETLILSLSSVVF